MRARSVNFERGKEPYKALGIGLGKTKLSVNKALNDLKDLGINADWRENEITKEIIELIIPKLTDHQVSYLPEEAKKWMDDKNESWGWGIYDLEDGDIIIESEPWNKILDKILELLV